MKIQINAGTLRHIVTIYQPPSDEADAINSFGNMVEWLPVGTTRVSIEPVSGREFPGSDRLNAEVSHRIYMRARPDLPQIMPQWSLTFQGRRFRIESILNPYEVGHQLVLACKELVE